MRIYRREEESVSISFLDVVTCGFGAITLMLTISNMTLPPAPVDVVDPRIARISQLQRSLFALQRDAGTAATEAGAREAELRGLTADLERRERDLAALRERREKLVREAAANAVIAGELKVAQQSLTEEMRRLLAQRKRARTDHVGGIPVDSEYIVFIIDTSGSMTRYAWPKVINEIVQTLQVYPRVKGMQVMNDEGTYMFPEFAGRWIADTPERRAAVIERLGTWDAYSNSSPVEGIEAAIEAFYSPDKKISLYVYGDEFTGKSIREVVDFVERVNREDARGEPMVRIHAVGFPTRFVNPPSMQDTGIRFATLMRELTRRNGGTFVGLNDFR